MPWRMPSSSRTLTVTGWATPQALSTGMARPEKPHIGNWAVPFMKSTTLLFLTRLSMRCWTSFMVGEAGGAGRSGIPRLYAKREAAAARVDTQARFARRAGPRATVRVRALERVVDVDRHDRRPAQVADGIVQVLAAAQDAAHPRRAVAGG